MKTLLTFLLITLTFTTFQTAKASEHLILTGGPALRSWEDLRVERDRHDRWWANFIRASTMRMDELRQAFGNTANITWLVYKTVYIKRGREDGKPYVTWIKEQAAKRGARLVWISGTSSVISAINSRRNVSTFDFFGHSNKHCFLLDYSSNLMGASNAWLHEKDLRRISPRVFAKKAICKSWGCHSGESMNSYWKAALGKELIGVKGKTDYAALSKGRMPAVNGSWVYRAP